MLPWEGPPGTFVGFTFEKLAQAALGESRPCSLVLTGRSPCPLQAALAKLF